MNNAHNIPQLVRDIDERLPQTQCTLCSYPRCYDYASAIYNGEAEINQCPPGGDTSINLIAELLSKDVISLNPEHGEHEAKTIAVIEEKNCIGCKLCIKACPVDCIVGSIKLMHTVISDQCTGCKLCIPVCPTDCIDMVTPNINEEDPSHWQGFTQQQVETARQNTEKKLLRETKKEKKQLQKRREKLQLEIRQAVLRKSLTISNNNEF